MNVRRIRAYFLSVIFHPVTVFCLFITVLMVFYHVYAQRFLDKTIAESNRIYEQHRAEEDAARLEFLRQLRATVTEVRP